MLKLIFQLLTLFNVARAQMDDDVHQTDYANQAGTAFEDLEPYYFEPETYWMPILGKKTCERLHSAAGLIK